MQPIFLGDVFDALLVQLQVITQANGYRTDAGLQASGGYVTDITGDYLNNEVSGDSLLVQVEEVGRRQVEGSLPLTVFGVTKNPSVTHLLKLEDDIFRALRDAEFHPRVKRVEFSAAKLGPGDNREFFGVSVPVRLHFTHSLI